jgi:hypothetical protein
MRLVHRCYATPRAYRNRIQPYSLLPPVPRYFFHLYDDMVALDPEAKSCRTQLLPKRKRSKTLARSLALKS